MRHRHNYNRHSAILWSRNKTLRKNVHTAHPRIECEIFMVARNVKLQSLKSNTPVPGISVIW